MTVKEYLLYWFENYAKYNCKIKTCESYWVNIKNHTLPYLADYKLSELKPVHLQNWIYEMQNKGLSPRSIQYVHMVFREALSHAYKLELIPRNVADMVVLPRQKKYKASYYDQNELMELIKNAKGTLMYKPVLLAGLCGLRRGEALGLQQEDIDSLNCTISIKHNLLPTKKGVILSDTKTEGSERVIDVSKSIIDELLKDVKGNYICSYPDGRYINPSNFSHLFADFLKAKGLRHIRYHDLRHSFTALALYKKIPLKAVSQSLGHSSVDLTLNFYSHVYRESQIELSNYFESILKEALE